jgi:hypothetical protein
MLRQTPPTDSCPKLTATPDQGIPETTEGTETTEEPSSEPQVRLNHQSSITNLPKRRYQAAFYCLLRSSREEHRLSDH